MADERAGAARDDEQREGANEEPGQERAVAPMPEELLAPRVAVGIEDEHQGEQGQQARRRDRGRRNRRGQHDDRDLRPHHAI